MRAATNVQGGTLELKDNGAGSNEGFQSSSITLSAGTTLALTASTGQTSDLRVDVSGSGSVMKQGAGTVRIGTFSGLPSLTYTGDTTVQAGNLELQGQAAGRGFDTTGKLVIASGAEFRFTGLAAQSAANAARFGALSGSGTVRGQFDTPFLEIGNGNGSDIFGGAITQDSGVTQSLIKAGTGTQTLSGSNSYTGTTTIDAGRLDVTGSTAGGSAVTVNSGGTLGGTGTVGGSVSVQSGGTLAPGTSPGCLSTGAVTLTSGTTFSVEINGNGTGCSPAQFDQLNVTGNVTLGGATLALSGSYTPMASDTFTIVTATGTVSGTFSASTFLLNGQPLQATYNTSAPGSVVLSFDSTPTIDAGNGNNAIEIRKDSGGNIEVVVDS